MFDPEFGIIVNNLAASKDIIKDSNLSYEYRNQHLKSFVDTLKYFYGEDLDDKLLDVLYHDAYKLVFESEKDIIPSLAKDGYVDAYVFKNTNDENSIYGHMTKKIATEGNYHAQNLVYVNGAVSRQYSFYEDNVLMNMVIDGVVYTKVAHINEDGNVEYAVFADEENTKTFILKADSYNIQDVIGAFMDMNKGINIKLLFPELFERSPYTLPVRTRK